MSRDEHEASKPGVGPRWRRFVADLGRRTLALGRGPRASAGLLWASRLFLVAAFVGYIVSWISANKGMLFDADLQNDDARTILFPFHAYGSQGTLGDDPIAQEMLSAVPWGVRLLYMAFVPVVDVYVAAKLVQLVALGVLVWAFVVLARSRRAGLGSAVFVVFLILHTTFASDRLGGGLPRGFGFPCFALWLAGIFSHNRVARYSAPIILALSYPSVMNMILAAEGLYALRGIFRVRWSVVGRRLRRYALLVSVCLVCVMPAAIGSSERGPIHTLEQAEKEPAFGRSGRLWILPFEKPVDAMTNAFIEPVMPRGNTPLLEAKWFAPQREMMAVLVLGFFLLLPTLRLSAGLPVAGAFFVGASVIYALSRLMAFSLYSPERYYSFGMRMACLALLFACVVHLFYWLRPHARFIARNLTVTALMGGMWLTTGDGLEKDSGIEIRRETERDLYDFIRTLPPEARFAAHVLDGDGIPFWGARAHTGSFETLQPWFVDSWARQKKRTNDTLAALYSSDEAEIFAFARKYKVTHLLVNRGRYKANFAQKARSFEPFSAEAHRLTRGKELDELVLAKPPKSATVFRSGRFTVLSVDKWEKSLRDDKRSKEN